MVWPGPALGAGGTNRCGVPVPGRGEPGGAGWAETPEGAREMEEDGEMGGVMMVVVVVVLLMVPIVMVVGDSGGDVADGADGSDSDCGGDGWRPRVISRGADGDGCW